MDIGEEGVDEGGERDGGREFGEVTGWSVGRLGGCVGAWFISLVGLLAMLVRWACWLDGGRREDSASEVGLKRSDVLITPQGGF